MAKQEKDALYVIAAAYDDVDAAVADYEAVKALYREVWTSHDFDASVIAKDENGNVRIVKKHEEPTRHGAAVGLGWGLAVGVAAVLFAPLGGVAGHVSGGMSRSDLKELGETSSAPRSRSPTACPPSSAPISSWPSRPAGSSNRARTPSYWFTTGSTPGSTPNSSPTAKSRPAAPAGSGSATDTPSSLAPSTPLDMPVELQIHDRAPPES